MPVHNSERFTILQHSHLLVPFQEVERVERLGSRGHDCREYISTALVEAMSAEGRIQLFGMCWIDII